MKIRFFGKTGCLECLRAYVIISQFDISCEYIDVDDQDENIQKFCDHHAVDQLPHLQFLNNNNEIVIEHIGSIDEKQFYKYIVEILIK